MAVWLPSKNKFYLPPQPVSRILSTDDYVERTALFYHASTDRLLTVGHPYYPITETTADQTIPKVSPNQFRVFRLQLPDPNNFAFGDKCVYDPESERLVWACRGLEVNRGGPLGTPITGHPLFSKYTDVENPFTAAKAVTDGRLNIGFDPKQTQMILLGCKPALGEHWKAAATCSGTTLAETECPPIELENTTIEDGDMVDIGLGNMDFASLQPNLAEAPLDVTGAICKYPDFIQMEEDLYGDRLFFFARRETLYARHMFLRGGIPGKESVPASLYKKQETASTLLNSYQAIPSGSLVSTESQLFNRPYWLQRAQGQNNGIAWHNELFLTIVDNTRGTILAINKKKTGAQENKFLNADYYDFVRHTEEFQLGLILQLCRVRLTPENLAFIHTMDPDIIDEWHLGVSQPNGALHEHYRYITSKATKCPEPTPPEPPKDRYKDLKFWVVDLSERITDQLDQTALGRKFLFQSGLGQRNTSRVSVPRPVLCRTSSCKRKRKTCAK
ncbi:L1 [Miniopterus schreibersii papillomavirus 1]|uniref:Major capsid protein L1 n=1 Tax=Miniopterus schreibersii papillomavirus 1 TaxID=1195364 RepID=J9R1I3_9PAPI|nr:L1 [Miniopterus schreibersii papillomavirus 1]AFR33949.1 L1 [Miniopterus schreibersii papillomavirus 1]